MNIRDLSYISAVARHGHFGRAAESCHVSQPALSSQIKKLERELGVIIFERDNKSVRLTDVGADIVRLAEEALGVVSRIRMTAGAAGDPHSGQLKLGFIPTIAPYLVPHFVKNCRAELPNLQVQFEENITERLNQALENGDLDVAILATPPDDNRLEAIPLYDEPFWVVFPERHDLRLLRGIHVEDLPHDELLLLAEGHCFRDQALDVCKIDAREQVRTIRATSMETLINMVTAGFGVTLIPAMALDGAWRTQSELLTEKLNDSKAYRRVYLTYRKTFPRRILVKTLTEILCQNLPDTVSSLLPTGISST